MDKFIPYILPAGFVLFFLWRRLKFRRIRKALPRYLEQGAQIVDVRSPAEFNASHFPDSINIPLGSLPGRAGKLNKEKPVLLCCASGARSGMAVAILKQQGFKEVLNIGPWQNLFPNQAGASGT